MPEPSGAVKSWYNPNKSHFVFRAKICRSAVSYWFSACCTAFPAFLFVLFVCLPIIIIVGEFLKLEIKIVQPGDELRLRRVAFDDYKFLAKESFDDKTAPVMLQSSFAEQLIEADVLLLVKPKRVFITRRLGLLVGLVCLFSVGIHI